MSAGEASRTGWFASPGDQRAAALSARLFDELRAAAFDGVGVTRECYAAGESFALDLVEKQARAAGLAVDRDAGANLVVTLPGTEPDLPFLACGSHLDSVPQGGNYDGAAGVVAALVLLAGLKAEGAKLRRTIRLFALRGEESAFFGKACLGSRALMGELTAEDLEVPNAKSGRSLGAAMADVGVDVDRVARSEPLLERGRVAAWIELHIEQGPVLIARDRPIGIVTGLRGNLRHRRVVCRGEPGHSGATPRALRHDAVFAAADLVMRLDRHWADWLERGADLVVTCGILGTEPGEHAIARIPGTVVFSFEVRSQDAATMDAFYQLFRNEAAAVATARGVAFETDRLVPTAPAVMDAPWVERLRGAARRLGLSDATLPSGAGHDAGIFACAGIPSAMIFVRNRNGSHNPAETMELDDFSAGLAVMRAALVEAAG